MLNLTKRNAQILYSAIQILFLILFALMFSFASVYLQGEGFSTGEIGVLLACTYACSAVGQPALSVLYAKTKISMERFAGIVYLPCVLLSLILLFLPLSKLLTGLIVVVVLTMESAVQPTLIAIANRWTGLGYKTDYAKARGIGSLFFGAVALYFGTLMTRVSSHYIPAFYMAAAAIMVALLFSIRTEAQPGTQEDEKKASDGSSWKAIAVLLAAIVCLSFAHTVVDNFLLQILQFRGGDSSHLGRTVAIGAVAECVAMRIYAIPAKKFGDRAMLVFAGFAWIAKLLLTLLAPTVQMVYVAEILQFFTFGFYTPAIAGYLGIQFKGSQYLKMLSLAGCAFTVGNILSGFVGGLIAEAWNINVTLAVALGAAVVGSILMLLAGNRKNREEIAL